MGELRGVVQVRGRIGRRAGKGRVLWHSPGHGMRQVQDTIVARGVMQVWGPVKGVYGAGERVEGLAWPAHGMGRVFGISTHRDFVTWCVVTLTTSCT